jgi:hypothetical protein
MSVAALAAIYEDYSLGSNNGSGMGRQLSLTLIIHGLHALVQHSFEHY